MILTADKRVDGRKIVDYLGTVRGEGTRRPDVTMEEVREQIVNQIVEAAKKLGADAVVEITHYQSPAPSETEILIESMKPVVYGRAVRLR